MAFDDTQILQEMVPGHEKAADKDGFDIHYDVVGSDGDNARLELNRPSLDSARARNEGGSNIAAATQSVADVDRQYARMYEKAGVQPTVSRILSPTPVSGAQGKNYRRDLSPPHASPKSSLRRLHTLRAKFDKMAAMHTKRVPQAVPESFQHRRNEEAILKGDDVPYKGVASPDVIVNTIARVALNSFAHWDAVGALAPGSFVNLAPRLKRP
jgi:hypothetical protein